MFARKSQVLAEHCRDVGTDFDAIVRSANINAVVGTSEADVKDRLDRVRARVGGLTNDAAADAMVNSMSSPRTGAGTPEQLVASLGRLRDLGCEYVICYFPEAAYDRSGIELFEREVIHTELTLRIACSERVVDAIQVFTTWLAWGSGLQLGWCAWSHEMEHRCSGRAPDSSAFT